MMDWEVAKYNRAVKRYDSMLFAKRSKKGLISVLRNHKVMKQILTGEDWSLSVLKEEPQFVICLTDNWSANGNFIPWGIDKVLDRLKQIDIGENEKLIESMDRENERIDELRKKSFISNVEDSAREMRKSFAKQYDDVLVHSMDKKDHRRKGDKKHGNSK